MKTRQNFLLALFAFSALFAVDAVAQRVKPTLPEPATIEADKYYYLYNEDAGFFMNYDYSDSYTGDYHYYYMSASPITERTFTFSYNENNVTYTIKNDRGRYFYSSDTNLRAYGTSIGNSYYFRMEQLPNGCYTIQRNYSYNANHYVSCPNKEGGRITAGDTLNRVWRLIPANDVEATRLMLYNALEKVGEGYNVDAYDELLSTSNSYQELLKAAKEMNTAVSFTSSYAQRGDYPIFFINDSEYPWSKYNDYGYQSYSSSSVQGFTSRLKAVVDIDVDEATLSYNAYSGSYNLLNVYVDGELVRSLPFYQNYHERKYYEILGKGTHTIEWEYVDRTNQNGDNGRITYISVEKTPTISVSLLEPGSLGAEILAQISDVKDVRRLKIKGEMNADDWARVAMIPALYAIDLSEAIISEIPASTFYNNNSKNYNFHQVVLPEGLLTIGDNAFRDTGLDEIILPSTLKTIGEYALAGTRLEKVNIPDATTTINNYAFSYCYSLAEVKYPEINYIPRGCFLNAQHLSKINVPKALKYVRYEAFNNCYYLADYELPATLKTIEGYGFEDTRIDTLIIPEGVTLGDYAFANCDKLKHAELPTTCYDVSAYYYLFHGCTGLKTIKLKSPTVVKYNSGYFVNNDYRANITLQVPDYLTSAYKLDSYWYNYGAIEGFATSEINKWTINSPLELSAKARLQGTPDIELNYTWINMKGETTMEVNNFNMNMTSRDYWSGSNQSYEKLSQVLVSADIDVKGLLDLDYYSYGNKWYFLSLPFDIKVGDIQCGAQYAIRYYDGANRAATGSASGNWKNYTADDIIEAGTGFIFQTSANVWTKFIACENTRKNRALKAKDLSTELAENSSESSAHRGWNLVGNPWMTWYNIHSVDFTAPITVYRHGNNNYTAYSIIDDDIALHPTQAFFVQCPTELDVITFPARGRQLTSEITNQNGAPSMQRGAASRQLVDLQLIVGEDEADKTRVVLNEEATLAYDYGKDASKFFADGNAAQLYTIDTEGGAYAINERPSDDGIVKLGFMAPAAGEYTFSLSRNGAASVILTDLLTGEEIELTQGDYTFSSEEGLFTDRFQLALKASATGVENVVSKTTVNVVEGGINATAFVQVYALDGRLVAEGDGFIALSKGIYLVDANGVNNKVVVK